VGDGIATVALVLLVSHGRPATAVGGLLLAESIPAFLAPVLGAVSDRMDRRTAMIQCELGQAAVYGVIAAWLPPYAGLLALVAVTSLLSRTFSAASKSAIPALVERDDLMPANALINTVFNLQVALGAALGGLLVSLSGTRTAIAIDAGSFLLSGLIMLALPRLPRSAGGSAESGLGRDVREGLTYVFRDPLLRTLVASMFAFIVFASLDNVAVVFLVRNVLGGSSFAYGAAMSAFGIGMIIATLGLVRRSRVHPATLILVSMLFTATGNLLVGLAPAVGFVIAFQLLGGVGNGLTLVGEDTLLQQHVPEHLMGRVFGAVASAIFVGSTVAYGAGGVFVDATSPRTALIASGIAVFVVAALVWPALSRAATGRGSDGPPAGE
jgi:MFS family permease